MKTPAKSVVCDNSLLADAAACDLRTVLRHVHGFVSRDEQAQLKAGSAVHECFAAYFETGSAHAARATFAAAYCGWALANVAANDRLSWNNTSRVVDEWLARHPIRDIPFEILRLDGVPAVEIGFAMALTDDVTICGRIDAIGVSKVDGKIQVIENKSTKSINDFWKSKFRLASQVTGYTAGAIEHLGREVTCTLINAIEFKWLPASDRKCATHKVVYAECGQLHANFEMIPIERTAEQIEAWKFTAIGLARKFAWLREAYRDRASLHDVPQQGLFTDACMFCFAKEWCAADRPIALLDSMFVTEPWEPWVGIMHETTEAKA